MLLLKKKCNNPYNEFKQKFFLVKSVFFSTKYLKIKIENNTNRFQEPANMRS